LQPEKWIEQGGLLAVIGILLFIVLAFIRGDIIPRSILDKIISETVSKTLVHIEEQLEKHNERTSTDHKEILDRMHDISVQTVVSPSPKKSGL